MSSGVPNELTELLAKSDEEVFYGIGERFDLYLPDYDVGSPVRVIGDVLEADFCIGEAGMHYLLTSEHEDLTSIPGSYETIGASAAAKTIRRAFSKVPEEVIRSTPGERREAIPMPEARDPIGGGGELTLAYLLQHQESVIKSLAHYIREHHESLVSLFEVEEFEETDEDW